MLLKFWMRFKGYGMELSKRVETLLISLSEIDAYFINNEYKISLENGDNKLIELIDIFNNYLKNKYSNKDSKHLKMEHHIYSSNLLKNIEEQYLVMVIDKIN